MIVLELEWFGDFLLKTRPLFSRTFSHLPPSPPPSTAPNLNQYLTLLQSCKTLKSLLQIHTRIIIFGLTPKTITATHLINLYSSFQNPHFSFYVFNSTPNPSIILWNSMIKAYTRSNQYEKAINLYHSMLKKSIMPDKYTFTFVLKACTGVLDLKEGILVHKEISKRRLECDVFIGTGLVDMYCKIGDLVLAKEVFDKMPQKDVVVWNAMIAGLSQSLNPLEALGLLRSMQFGGCLMPNKVSLLNLFPAVCKLLDVRLCKCIHGYVVRRDFESSVLNGLIDVYSKCGKVDIAYRVFELMPGRDDVSWGTIMSGYAYNGNYSEVLEIFDQMREECQKMNIVSVVSALIAAAEMRDLKKGREIHQCAIQIKIDSDVLVATPLMTMYSKCGEIKKAKELFAELEEKDVVAWSAVIAAFAQSGYPEEALSLFRDMQDENPNPNAVTLVGVLPACAEQKFVKLGKSLHCSAVKATIDCDIAIATALVSMYAKCDVFSSALTIFDRMSYKEVVAWNALINAYAQAGNVNHAMKMFHQLLLSAVHPDAGTMVGVISASALLGNLGHGKSIHGHIMKSGFESDCHVINALIDMYTKSGNLSTAKLLFRNSLITKDEISWNTMIAGYMHTGQAKEAISLFHQMKFEGIQPNLVTIVSILPAAASISDIKEGMAFHVYIIQRGFYSNMLIGNSLIDMYSKCGRLDYAEKVFGEMESKDTVSWNAMLAGYAIHAHGNRAFDFFSLMQESSVEVDHVSFLSVLSACRHSGLVEEGRKIFHSMHKKSNLEPNLEHYACMVDLLGRAGLFDEVLNLIKTMPMEPDARVWGALLAACRMHSNVKLAEVALNYLVKLEPGNPAHYVVLSGIYAESGRWGDARSIRMKMNDAGLNKNPGCSWFSQNRDLCISDG